ncbi:MAG: hypothetical protein CMM52_01435 [Rhodospirillaceae bacterium]|nr:hypothetical protein [Rhodospirillaceae bacterium]
MTISAPAAGQSKIADPVRQNDADYRYSEIGQSNDLARHLIGCSAGHHRQKFGLCSQQFLLLSALSLESKPQPMVQTNPVFASRNPFIPIHVLFLTLLACP